MKQRFSSLDVKVITHELSNSLCSLRLANVYDLSSRIFLLKFAKPSHKQQMVIDSGFRCHLTSFTRATAAAPSIFVTRLRKYLRTRRVTSITQVGTDRIIEIQFSDGQYRLFLEFYAGGNIVLTDKELNILALLRVVSEGSEQEELRVGLKYSLENRQNYRGVPVLTKDRLKGGLQKSLDKANSNDVSTNRKSKKKSGDVLRKALSTTLTEFPPLLIDHAFRVTGFNPEITVEEVLKDQSLLDKLMFVLKEAQMVIEQITSSESSKGYIIAKPMKHASVQSGDRPPSKNRDQDSDKGTLLYEDFHPFRPLQFEEMPDVQILEFEGFNSTVDEFFSSIEAQKLESRLTEREEHAKKKLENARQDHEKRLGGLQQVQELNIRKAQAIEANLSRVREATAAVNGLIGQGMDWVEIARLIEMEQSRHNPVAEIIKLPLKLFENVVTLLLGEEDFEDEGYFDGDETGSDVSDSEDDEKSRSKPNKPVDNRLSVDIDLALSPWSNARQYYDQKKTAAVKEQKTIQSSAKALKSTEKKITADLKKGLKQEKEVLRPVRKQMWFEKFTFFISSDGYLVLGGRDIQQNEMLYKKYLKKGDIYVHADLQGAASVIIKNKVSTPDAPIPPSTLSQAGTLAVATSSAWDSKAMMAAWWVKSDQVSKLTAAGDYLPPGIFATKGIKTFLPPAQLLLGFGIIFRISEESKAKHFKHRFQDPSPELSLSQDMTANMNVDTEAASSDQGPREETESEIDSDSDQAEQDETTREPEANDDNDHDCSMQRHDNPLLSNDFVMEQSKDDENDLSEDALDEDYDSPNDELDNETPAFEESRRESVKDPDETSSSIVNEILKPGHRHLSARERRLLRQGQDPTQSSSNAQRATDRDKSPIRPASASKSAMASTGASPSSKSAPLSSNQVRGKHGKRAKVKEKYKEQDDSDRAIALRLLGSSTAQQKAVDEAAAKASHDAEAAVQKQRRREQHAKAVAQGKEEEERRTRRLAVGKEGADDEEGDENEQLEREESALLENFVGTPLPGDEILDAVVVCGPWDAVGTRCRWKAKLQPGAVKKGKAVREILGRWNALVLQAEKGRKRPAEEEEDPGEQALRKREADYVRGLREQEIVGQVPVGKVRVIMGGGEAGKGVNSVGGKGKGRGGRGGKK